MIGLELPNDLRYPSRKAAQILRGQVVQFLQTTQPAFGSRLLTDQELVDRTKLSRSTVRRALDELHREGWIERRIGQGTFVGIRASTAPSQSKPEPKTHEAQPTPGVSFRSQEQRAEPHERRAVRVAVLIFEIGDLARDWYTPLILEGIDQAGEEFGVAVELLGNRDRDVNAISRRLRASRPDVLACLAPEPMQAFVIRDAQTLGIPVLVTGTPHMGLGLPVICEDNQGGAKLAVQHLLSKGHRDIALVMQRNVERWVFDRHEGYVQALVEAGLPADESLVHWLPMGDGRGLTTGAVDGVEAFIRRRKPTAVISGNGLAMECLDQLVNEHRLTVPRDVSVVCFEQNTDRRKWLGGVTPTSVVLPLNEMGRVIAKHARELAGKRTIAGETVLSCSIREGSTVTPVASPSE